MHMLQNHRLLKVAAAWHCWLEEDGRRGCLGCRADLVLGVLLQGCLLGSGMLLLQLHTQLSMLLPRHHQLAAQGCLGLHSSGQWAMGKGS